MLERKLYLGVSREFITPEIGGKLYGYNDTTRSESIHDELTATAFVFEYGGVKAVLITATVCLIKNELALNIRKQIADELSIPTENCILCATHTHSGPNTAGEHGCEDVDEAYCKNIFIPRLIKVAKDANCKLQQVEMGIESGASYVGINRRELTIDNTVILGQNNWGPFNPVMTVISFKNSEDKIVANLIHYGAHGTAAGLNTEITRDWSGVMVDALENLTGGITAFINGPEGDVGPRLSNGGTMGDIHHVKMLGDLAAKDACNIYKKIKDWHNAELKCHKGTIKIPLQSRRSKEYVENELKKFEHGFADVNGAGTKKLHLEEVLQSYKSEFLESAYKEIEQSIICIGDISFVAFPYELFSTIGMRIQEYMNNQHILALSNANGCEGYFVTEDQICRGGYEVDMFLASGIQEYVNNADWYLVKETIKNLEECLCIE